MPDLAAETELLCTCVRHSLAPGEDTADLAPVLGRVNWHHVLWLGAEHGVLQFLRQAVLAGGAAAWVPPGVRAQLEVAGKVAQLRSLARAREMCVLQDLFDLHGIDALAIDDWSLAQAHAGQPENVAFGPAFRYLVRGAERARAKAVLQAAGHRGEATPLELIRKDRSPVLLGSAAALTAREDHLWAAARSFELGGRTLRCPAASHCLWQRLRNAVNRKTMRLKDVWELIVLARRVDAAVGFDPITDAVEFQLTPSWIGLVAKSFDQIGLPRPRAFAAVAQSALVLAARDAAAVDRAPFLPSAPAVARRMLEFAAPGPEDIVYDLGCGDGRLVVAAATDFGARGVGIDLDPASLAKAAAAAAAAGVSDRTSFVCADLFAQDLGEATVLCLYLLPGFLARLREKIMRQCRPGLRIVSHDYAFPGWPPEKTEIVQVGSLKVSQIYFWRLE